MSADGPAGQGVEGSASGAGESLREEALVRRWREAAERPAVDTELRAIHAAIDEATRAARPLCVASGACCRFEEFGHRLYTTGLETAWCLRRLRLEQGRALGVHEVDAALVQGTCPFLRSRLCSVHELRPFACRTFFCDPRATEWQTAVHERCHARVRALHEREGVPYRYAEWRTLLRLLGE